MISTMSSDRRQQAEKDRRALKIRRIQLDREKRERDLHLAKKRERKRRQKSNQTDNNVRRTVSKLLLLPTLLVVCVGAAITLCSYAESVGKDTPFWQDLKTRGTYRILGPVLLCSSVVLVMAAYILYKHNDPGGRKTDTACSQVSTGSKVIAITELSAAEADKSMTSLPLLVVHAPDDGVEIPNGMSHPGDAGQSTKEHVRTHTDRHRVRSKTKDDTMVPVDVLIMNLDTDDRSPSSTPSCSPAADCILSVKSTHSTPSSLMESAKQSDTSRLLCT